MKQLTIDDFLWICVPVEYIPWKELESVMGKEMYDEFIHWMRGQTSYIGGAYPSDVRRFLRNYYNKQT